MIRLRARRRFVIRAAVSIFLACARANAAEGTPPPKPKVAEELPIVPPRLVSEAAIEYPAGATGDAVVVLAVTVNSDGTVRTARALEGQEPFVEAAIAAATTFRFDPATRGGKAISAI